MLVTNEGPDPDLVVRPSALSWRRTILVGYFVAALFLVTYLVLAFVLMVGTSSGPLYGILLGGLILISALVLLTATGIPGDKAEVRAGYTTLFRNHPNLPQLDPKTGRVIRKAGEPYLHRRDGRGSREIAPVAAGTTLNGQPVARNREIAPAPLGPLALNRRPSPLVSVRGQIIGFLLAGVIFVVMRSTIPSFSRLPFWIILVALVGSLVLTLASVLVVAAPSRRLLARLSPDTPSSLAVAFRPTPDTMAAFAKLGVRGVARDAGGYGKTSAIIADRNAIRLLDPDARELATFQWPSVRDARLGTVSGGSNTTSSTRTNSTVELTVISNGGPVVIQLAGPTASRLGLTSTAESRWVLRELQQLKAVSA